MTKKGLAFISSHGDKNLNGNHSYQVKSVCSLKAEWRLLYRPTINYLRCILN